MKALTVRQPWAFALVLGYKPVENRTTLWKHRGLLLIHAAAGFDPWEPSWREHGLLMASIRHEAAFGDKAADVLFQARGAVIGSVDVIDTHLADWGCCPPGWAEEQDDSGRKVHMVVENAVRFNDPIEPVTGALGLWDVPDDVEEMARARMAQWPRSVG